MGAQRRRGGAAGGRGGPCQCWAAGHHPMIALLSGVVVAATAAIELPGASFGTAYKGCFGAPLSPHSCLDPDGKQQLWPFDTELTVFEHDCDATVGADSICVMSHFWCGGNWPGYENSRLRYYVDGEATASVDIPIGLGNGSPHVNPDEPPWSAGALFG